MKIACICNLNNNLFSVVRYLRDMGYDAYLLLFDNEEMHFHPSNDALDDTYRSYTRQLKWGSGWSFMNQSPDVITADLEEFDFLIGSGAAPAFVSRAGRALDLFVSSGGDIFEDAMFKVIRHPGIKRLSLNNIKYQVGYYRFTRAQRAGLAQAKLIVSRNALSRRLARKFGYAVDFATFDIPLVYDGIYRPEKTKTLRKTAEKFPVLQQGSSLMHQYRERHFPLIFLPSRQLWKSRPHKFSNKGTDILVRGFADFVKNASGADPCLVMLEYGLDVDATKRLVGELGIEDHVRWLPMLPRRDIMACLTYCDVVGTHFGHGFFMSGVTFEALSMAKPIMGRRDNDNMNAEFAEDYPELYPIMNVNSSEGVTAALGDFLDRPDHYAEMGKRGREWYLTEVVERFQKEIRGLIKGAGTVNR